MKEEQFRNKIYYFTFLFSIMVIWVHSFNSELFLGKTKENVRISAIEYLIGGTISQIAVPGFFMISAYLFYRNFNLRKLWKKWNARIKSILVPFVVWNVLYYAGYIISSRIPLLMDVVGRGKVEISLKMMVRSILYYVYNPVFWYMYQLILLIFLAPVIYLILKNKLLAVLGLVVLIIFIDLEVKLTPLNTDALFYYSAAAFTSLHFREKAEGLWNFKRGLTGALIIISGIVVYFYCETMDVIVRTVLYRCLIPAGLWLLVNESWLSPAREFMKHNFFLYAVHFAIIRFINKAGAMLLPAAPAVPLMLYICMPLIIVPVCFAMGSIMRKHFPWLWLFLNGPR